MSITFGQAFGAGGGAAAGGWSTAIITSRSITFTEAGTVCLSVVGAGGGGAANSGGAGAASGGNSGPWGRKKFKVAAGDVLAVTLGAGGLKAASTATNGAQGSTTTVTLNGVTILTVQGGEGGKYVAGAGPAQPISPAATVTGADYWVPGVRAGSASGGSTSQSGGAAVDVLGNGLGKSPNSTSSVGVGGSVGTDSGGVSLAWLALTDFGISITDPSQANASVGAPGRGADGTVLAGAFGGGSTNDSYRATAGIGAGGGAGSSVAVGAGGCGPGGKAYAYLCFAPEA